MRLSVHVKDYQYLTEMAFGLAENLFFLDSLRNANGGQLIRFLLFFALVCTLNANEVSPNISVLLGDSEANICDCANVITGKFYLAETDLVVRGVEPIPIIRFYCEGSESGKQRKKYLGWEIFPHTYLEVDSHDRDYRTRTITVTEPSGAKLRYRYKSKSANGKCYEIDFTKDGVGITNTSNPRISSQTNIRNQKVYRVPGGYIVRTPEGGERHYKDRIDNTYLLVKEVFPNGNVCRYSYVQRLLARVSTHNPTEDIEYAWVEVGQLEANKVRTRTLRTSDGRTVKYTYERGYYWYLKRAELPDGRCKEYDTNIVGIGYYRLANGEKIIPAYYHKDSYEIEGEKIEISSSRDYRFDRLYQIYFPLKGQRYYPVYTFKYGYSSKTSQRLSYVYDAYLNCSKFSYSKEFRPDKIEFFEKDEDEQVLKLSEEFTWKDGNLIRKSLSDNKKSIERNLSYTDKYNLKEEWITGDLTGSGVRSTFKTKFSYNDRHLLSKIHQLDGATSLLEYHPELPLKTAEIREDGATYYRYDKNNHLFQTIYKRSSTVTTYVCTAPWTQQPAVGMPHVIEEGWIENGVYTPLHIRQKFYNEYALVSHEKVFDQAGNLAYTLYFTYDESGRKLSETNALGQRAEYAYDALGNVSYERRFDGLEVFNTYDPIGNLIATKELGSEVRITTYTYDLKGRKSSTTDYLGNTIHLKYDSRGFLVEKIHPKQIGKDESAIELFVRDAFGNEVTYVDPCGNETHKTYNARNQLSSSSSPSGRATHNLYTLDGQIAESKDVLSGTRCYYAYNTGRRLTSKSIYSGQDELLSKEGFEYDGEFLKQYTDPMGVVTRYIYDKAGRKSVEEIDYGNGIETKIYRYDNLGRLYKTIHGNRVVVTKYDLLDQIIEERIEDLNGALLSLEEYAYDLAGNQTEVTTYVHDRPVTCKTIYDSFHRPMQSVNELGEIVQIQYDTYTNSLGQRTLDMSTGVFTLEFHDAMGRLVCIQSRDVNDHILSNEERQYNLKGELVCQNSNGHIVLFDYSAEGELICQTEMNGRVTTHEYDSAGRRVKTVKPCGVSITYNYDPLGRMIKKQTKGVCYEYRYDAMGKPVEIHGLENKTVTNRTYDHRGNIVCEQLGNGLIVRKKYDAHCRATEVILPDHSKIEYEYDALYIRRVTRSDPDGKLKYEHHYTQYDLAGNLLAEESSVGVRYYVYDNASRLLKCDQQAIHGYDSRGNMTGYVLEGEEHSFEYNSLDQLIAEDMITYAYDPHHNRISKNGTTEEYSVNNELIKYRYDLNGNLIDPDYEYDGLGRLVRAGSTLFTYDAFNRRLSKNGENFVYDGVNEIGAYVDGRAKNFRCLALGRGAEIGAAVGIELEGTAYIPSHNAHGDLIKLKKYGFPYSAYRSCYTSYGEAVVNQIPDNPWGYRSKRYDRETGLIFFGRRYYDAETGRWTTPDPAGYSVGPNLYAYLKGNPVKYQDLYGLEPYMHNGQVHVPLQDIFRGIGGVIRGLGAAIGNNALGSGLQHIGQCFTGAGNFLDALPLNKGPQGKCIRRGASQSNTNTRITYTNGILNNNDEVEQTTEYIKEIHGGVEVTAVYNASYGILLDIVESFLQYVGVPTRNERLLVMQWKKDLREMGPTGELYHYAHSQGSITTRNALRSMSAEQKQRMHVTTFGAACLFADKELASLRHYVMTGDPVCMLSPIQLSRARSGNHPHVHFISRDEECVGSAHAFFRQDGMTGYMKALNKESETFRKSKGLELCVE